jgi:hypothetical protein
MRERQEKRDRNIKARQEAKKSNKAGKKKVSGGGSPHEYQGEPTTTTTGHSQAKTTTTVPAGFRLASPASERRAALVTWSAIPVATQT